MKTDFDHEATASYALKISVSDGTEPGTADITVNVTEVSPSGFDAFL